MCISPPSNLRFDGVQALPAASRCPGCALRSGRRYGAHCFGFGFRLRSFVWRIAFRVRGRIFTSGGKESVIWSGFADKGGGVCPKAVANVGGGKGKPPATAHCFHFLLLCRSLWLFIRCEFWLLCVRLVRSCSLCWRFDGCLVLLVADWRMAAIVMNYVLQNDSVTYIYDLVSDFFYKLLILCILWWLLKVMLDSCKTNTSSSGCLHR